jgi:hypothetical protein
MKLIFSRYDPKRDRWVNAPAVQLGGLDLVCAKANHVDCMHGDGKRGMKDFAYTSTVSLRNTVIQSLLFTKETCIIKLMPKNGAK